MATVGVTTARKVVHTPGVVGGSARLERTRIPVWLLVEWARQGWTVEKIQSEYPQLTTADVESALDYAAENAAEIEHDIQDQDDDSE